MLGKRIIRVVTLGLAGWLVIPLLARASSPGRRQPTPLLKEMGRHW